MGFTLKLVETFLPDKRDELEGGLDSQNIEVGSIKSIYLQI